MKKRSKLIGLLAVALLIGAAVFGTWAWMTNTSKPLTNTFVAGTPVQDEDKDFVLTEHGLTQNDDGSYVLDTTTEVKGNNYKVQGAVDLPKDPWVKVDLDNENNKIQAYLFIEVIDTLPDAINLKTDESEVGGWTIDSAHWTPLMNGEEQVKSKDGNPIYVYNNGQPFGEDLTSKEDTNIMTQDANNNSITVPGTIKPTDLNETTNLVFQAYLCQAASFNNAYDAWDHCWGASANA